MNTTISRMRIWTVGVVFLCYLFVSIGGQLQASLKRISGDTTSKQDGNIKQVSLSTFRLEHDNGYHESIAQQSFALIAEDETTRRLGTTQVNFLFIFLRILAFIVVLSFIFDDPLVVVVIIVRMYRTSSSPLQARGHREVVVMVERPLLLNCIIPMGYRWYRWTYPGKCT